MTGSHPWHGNRLESPHSPAISIQTAPLKWQPGVRKRLTPQWVGACEVGGAPSPSEARGDVGVAAQCFLRMFGSRAEYLQPQRDRSGLVSSLHRAVRPRTRGVRVRSQRFAHVVALNACRSPHLPDAVSPNRTMAVPAYKGFGCRMGAVAPKPSAVTGPG